MVVDVRVPQREDLVGVYLAEELWYPQHASEISVYGVEEREDLSPPKHMLYRELKARPQRWARHMQTHT
jgi:hypothetical protein